MKPIRLATCLLAILGGAALLDAQAPSPREQQAPPIFRSGVELVRLDVRVADDQGRPIKDLKAEDIAVEEGGRRRPIVLFQHVAEPSGSYVEVARRTIGAEVSTNQGAPRGHLYVLVFDQLHITPGNEQRARVAAERFLRTRVRPGDRVALYALPGPGPQLPFSSNVQLALDRLPEVRGALDRQALAPTGSMTVFEAAQIVRGDPQVLQRILTRASEENATLDLPSRTGRTAPVTRPEAPQQAAQVATDAARTIVSHADATARHFLVSLTDLIRSLAPIEGRKSVILISEGFFNDNLVHDVERVAAAAAQSYAVIYSFDVNRRGIDINASQATGGEPSAEIQSRLESLGTLAAETDGELVVDANSHMDAAMNQVADSGQDYYIVGFEPPAEALANREQYRRVSVKVTRPGAHVSARTGYALSDPSGPADRRRSIDIALSAPFAQQGLPLEMTTYVLHGISPGANRVFVSLQADLPVRPREGGRPADVVFVARNARDGRVAASGTDIMRLPAAAGPGRTTGKGQFQVQFEAPPGEYLMRVAVREPGGSTGTVDRRFEVRDFDGVDITASDLIIGRRPDVLPVRAAAYVSEGLTGAMEVYARNPDDLRTIAVTVDLVPQDGTTAVRSVRADLLDVKQVGVGARRAVQVALPLTDVKPGQYIARATLTSHGETVMELVRQVDVIPGTAPAPVVAVETATPGLILGGELARRYLASLEADSDRRVAAAAGEASVGAWDKVSSALGEPTPGRGAGVHALRGLSLFAAGRYPAAAEALQAAMTLDSRSPLIPFFLGWVRSLDGKHAEAVNAWQAAVRLDPTLVSAYLAMADTQAKLGHPELASQVLKEGLRAVPNSPELTNRLLDLERR